MSVRPKAWEEYGQTDTEYSLAAVLIALLLIVVLLVFRDELADVYQSIIGR